MIRQDRYAKYLELREAFPVFTYESYNLQVIGRDVKISFRFRLGRDFVFQPCTVLKNVDVLPERLSDPVLQNMAFHIGLVEMISYWKACCSPEIHIECSRLDEAQCAWWKKLFIYGLGEFFYTNGIPVPDDTIFSFTFSGHASTSIAAGGDTHLSGALLPVGGGKDSVVSLELLKDKVPSLMPYVINPRPATDRVIESAGLSGQPACITLRYLDPHIIQLNDRGFLNGHTPFSAMLAFHALMAAYLMKKKDIILSNESSANEPSIPGTMINHQYSKSLEFETDFRNYIRNYIHTEIQYYSFLRPLNELQISGLFSKMTHQHKGFRSCNAGSKTDIWCCQCSKCLFTYIMLAPYMSEKALNDIFGIGLLDQQSLLGVFLELCGESETKPFECVGTIGEVNAALVHLLNRYENHDLPIPVLLQHYKQTEAYQQNKHIPIKNYLTAFTWEGFPERNMKTLLTNHLKSISLNPQP